MFSWSFEIHIIILFFKNQYFFFTSHIFQEKRKFFFFQLRVLFNRFINIKKRVLRHKLISFKYFFLIRNKERNRFSEDCVFFIRNKNFRKENVLQGKKSSVKMHGRVSELEIT